VDETTPTCRERTGGKILAFWLDGKTAWKRPFDKDVNTAVSPGGGVPVCIEHGFLGATYARSQALGPG
jgi:hypothetical protein